MMKQTTYIIALASAFCGIAGCTFWKPDYSFMHTVQRILTIDDRVGDEPASIGLPNIPLPNNAIVLETRIVERPVGDPLLGHALWQELGEVGSLTDFQRESLRVAGFRIGHAGSNPPPTLARLLDIISGDPDPSALPDNQGLPARRMMLPSGSKYEIEVSSTYPVCPIRLPSPEGERLEIFKNARCMMRVTPRKLQEGWVKIDFEPQIHHGIQRWRPISTEVGWKGRTSQNIVSLFAQRFAVELNKGEMIVITAAENSDDTLASKFFRTRGADGWEYQRLLIIRLVDIRQTVGTYAE